MGGFFYLFIVYVIIVFLGKIAENIKKESTTSAKKSSTFLNELTSLLEDDSQPHKKQVMNTPSKKRNKQQIQNTQKKHAKKQASLKRNATKEISQKRNARRNDATASKTMNQTLETKNRVVFPKSELENPKSLATTSQKNTDATAILCDLFMELQDYLRGVSLESLPISRLDREFIAEFMTISNDGFHYTSRHEFIVLAGRFERIVFKNPGLPDQLVKRIKKITDYVVFLQTGQKNTAKPAKEVMNIASTKAKKPVMKLNKLTQMVVYKEIFDKPVSKR